MIKRSITYLIVTALMLCVSSGAWAAYYILGSSCLGGLSAQNVTAMVSSGSTYTYTFMATCGGNQFFRIYDANSSNESHCVYCSGCSQDLSLNTDYSFTSTGSQKNYNINLTNGTTYTISITNAGVLRIVSGSTSYSFSTSGSNVSFNPPSQSIAQNGSAKFEVTPSDGFKLTNASVTNAICSPSGALGGLTTKTDIYVSNPTAAGTLTITAVARTTYTVTLSGSGCVITPNSVSDRTIYEGDSKVYTATPTAGYVYKTSSYGNGSQGTLTRVGNTFTLTPTASATLTIVYASEISQTPVVRMGKKPSESDCGISLSAYLASKGCSTATVSSFHIYYANNSMFRSDGEYKADKKDVAASNPGQRSLTALTLTKAEVQAVASHGETLYVRISAENGNGEGETSDIVSIPISCHSFSTNDIDEPFTACEGEHQFTWSSMFSPTPTSYSVVNASTGDDATAMFSLDSEGNMVWNPVVSIADGWVTVLPSGTYEYTFTAKRDGYDDATATLSTTYTATSSSDQIAGIKVGDESSPSDETNTTPFTDVTLKASETSASLTDIEWTVTPVSEDYTFNVTAHSPNSVVIFRGRREGTYTVRARGVSSNCGSSQYKEIVVQVGGDTEPCGE